MASLFVMPTTRPPYTKGMVVLHSDDGEESDYGRFKLFTRLGYAHNQWAPYNKVPFCPAVNTGYIAGRSRVGLEVMHPWQLQDIVSLGGEIVSHGRYHAYLDFMSLSQPLSAGDSVIRLKTEGTGYNWNACVAGYTYTVEENSLVETVQVEEIGRDESGAYVKLTTPLTNSFSANAKLHITEASALDLMQGAIDDLAAIGITCKHHVCAWYRRSERAKAWMQQVFESVVTTETDPSNLPNPEDVDLYDIRRTPDIAGLSTSQIDQWLDAVQSGEGKVAFVQGHAGTSASYVEKWTYLVNECFRRGIRIVTHSEAVEYIKQRKAQAAS